MLGRDHVLFLKKILKLFSGLCVCSLYNSESGPKILQFLDKNCLIFRPDCLMQSPTTIM